MKEDNSMQHNAESWGSYLYNGSSSAMVSLGSYLQVASKEAFAAGVYVAPIALGVVVYSVVSSMGCSKDAPFSYLNPIVHIISGAAAIMVAEQFAEITGALPEGFGRAVADYTVEISGEVSAELQGVVSEVEAII